MNEFSQMIELVKQELLRGDAQMEVLGAYPQQLRARPQRQKLAVVAIQKVLMQPLGMQSFLWGRESAAGQAGAGLDEGKLLLSERGGVLAAVGKVCAATVVLR